jgi:hypothetical protein
MTLLDAQLAARLGKTTEEVAGMTWDELLRIRDDVQRQIDELNARIAVLEAAQAIAHNIRSHLISSRWSYCFWKPIEAR